MHREKQRHRARPVVLVRLSRSCGYWATKAMGSASETAALLEPVCVVPRLRPCFLSWLVVRKSQLPVGDPRVGGHQSYRLAKR